VGKSPKPQVRDPEATKARILAASKKEFARKGLGGARVDAIATQAKSNKRMMYHYFGNKEHLFQLTLEQAYSDFREAEARLELEKEEPVAAIRKLVTFVWTYFIENPEFITLVNSENLHKAKHLKNSDRSTDMSRSFVGRMQALLERGAKLGVFRDGLDPVQFNITVAAIGYYYLTNQYTGSIVFERDLMNQDALAARLDFNVKTILRLVCTAEALAQIEKDEMKP
jgi:AcrR family transcriptional regulator